jgi:hypothetical protein
MTPLLVDGVAHPPMDVEQQEARNEPFDLEATVLISRQRLPLASPPSQIAPQSRRHGTVGDEAGDTEPEQRCRR